MGGRGASGGGGGGGGGGGAARADTAALSAERAELGDIEDTLQRISSDIWDSDVDPREFDAVLEDVKVRGAQIDTQVQGFTDLMDLTERARSANTSNVVARARRLIDTYYST